ncbi:hypothetical protein K458DRAFT_402140 [Lentithecium fluviatile CBS 122367]|uniref:RRM domain-containing protein n=1 Tax=Lentithecium fluviatile CBS 122367 TaxID=1168545 RepID=A0A6G1J7L4_9PLEO|nr:hypothetical protein K458DRAFT_402140 [Lentithecium fluviatile CBS 122367]
MASTAEYEEFEASLGVPALTAGADSSTTTVVETPQKRKNPPKSKDTQPNKIQKVQENRAVYVTNIPRDATVEEVEEEFKKFGIIDQGVDGKPRIKMYTDEDGKFNGEALIVYFKPDSVHLAIQMLDERAFRLGDFANGTMDVQAAEQSFKKNTDKEKIAHKLVRKERKVAERQFAENIRKLSEWSDNEEQVKETYAPKKNKWAKMAIVKNAFTLDMLEEDARAILETKEDMREAAGKFGEVTKTVLYDLEPEGIVVIRFKDFEAAEAFKAGFNGKNYNDGPLEIAIAEDRPKFKKSKNKDDSDDDAAKVEAFLNDDDSD